MPASPTSLRLIPAERARQLAETLTEGDLEFLIRQTRARIRREEKRGHKFKPEPGQRDANQHKVGLARDLEGRLVAALGREPRDNRGDHRG